MEKKKNVERNGRGFASVIFVAGSHDHIQTRAWIHNDFVIPGEAEGREALSFPVKGAQIDRTVKGSLVMRPSTGTVFFFEIISGYRGSAQIDRVDGGEIIASGVEYHSGQGSLGETAWALINASGRRVEVYGQRSGRRIDKRYVDIRLTDDGEVEELLNDSDVCDLLDAETRRT